MGLVEGGRREPDRVDIVSRLSDVARALATGSDSNEVLADLVEHGVAALGGVGALLAEADHDTGTIVPIAVHGSARRSLAQLGTLRFDDSHPVCDAVRNGSPVWVVTRLDAMARYPVWAGVTPESRSWAALPLVAGDDVVGVLVITFEEERDFDVAEREFLDALAALCTLALRPVRDAPRSLRSVPAVLDDPDEERILRRLETTLIRDLFAVTLDLGAVASIVDAEARERLERLIERHDHLIEQIRGIIRER